MKSIRVLSSLKSKANNAETMKNKRLQFIKENVEKEVYDYSKGLCVIFDQRKFADKSIPENQTNEEDVKLIQDYFKEHNFILKHEMDLTSTAIEAKLKHYATVYRNVCDCLIVFVLTYCKEKNVLEAFNRGYNLEILFNIFIANELFVGKPKIFFIVTPELSPSGITAGIEESDSNDSMSDEDENYSETWQMRNNSIVIPGRADFLVSVWSPKYEANLGSKYLRVLFTELVRNKSENQNHLVSLLIGVNQKMSEIDSSWNNGNEAMPLRSPYSTLTRKLFI